MSTRSALGFAAIRGLRTAIQGLAGVAASYPVVATMEDARTAGVVAGFGALAAGVAGVAAFLQNFAEKLGDA